MSPAVITAQTKASHGLAFLLSGGRVGWGQDQGWLPVSLSLGPGWRPEPYTWSECYGYVVQFYQMISRGGLGWLMAVNVAVAPPAGVGRQKRERRA